MSPVTIYSKISIQFHNPTKLSTSATFRSSYLLTMTPYSCYKPPSSDHYQQRFITDGPNSIRDGEVGGWRGRRVGCDLLSLSDGSRGGWRYHGTTMMECRNTKIPSLLLLFVFLFSLEALIFFCCPVSIFDTPPYKKVVVECGYVVTSSYTFQL